MSLSIEQAAEICHEVNRAYCSQIGEHQPPYDMAPDWQKNSAIDGVEFHLLNPNAGDDASHKNWLRQKEADGWTYGPTKDASAKQHPCMVPFEQLPRKQRVKDALFRSTVNALRPLLEPAETATEARMKGDEWTSHEQNLESDIQSKGLTAPRITPGQIDETIAAENYYVFPGTTVTVCCLTLRNGYCVVGHSAAASPENFDEAIGRRVAFHHARDQIWSLEGYLLRQRLAKQANDAAAQLGQTAMEQNATPERVGPKQV